MPGTGKTTISHKLKRVIEHSLIIGRNSIKEWISDFKNNDFEENLIYNIMLKSSDICLVNNYSVIIDGAGWKNDFYQKFKKIAQKNKTKFISVRLICDLETSRKRTLKRKIGYRWSRERLKNFKNIFEKIPTDIIVSSDVNSPTKITKMICEKIQSKI